MPLLGHTRKRTQTSTRELEEACEAKLKLGTMPNSPNSSTCPSETMGSFEVPLPLRHANEEPVGREAHAPPNGIVESKPPGSKLEPSPIGEVSTNVGDVSLCKCGSQRTKWAGCRVHQVCATFCEDGLGYCACGFPKDEHTVCDEYRVGLEARTFGDCRCGFAKEHHASSAISTRLRSSQRESEDDLRARFTQKEKASCLMYRVNLQSASFGECLCGLPKASHSDEALKQNAEKRHSTGMTTRRDENELRSKFVQREYAECANYEIDMAPGVQYGMCRCGKPRAEHSARALQGGKHEFKSKRSDEDVIAQMKARAAAAEAANVAVAPTLEPAPPTEAAPTPAPPKELICQPATADGEMSPQSLLKQKSLMKARRVMD